MVEPDEYNFNNVITEIIKKSLFTQRQIEIILKCKNLIDKEFNISRGAYFRQVSQSKKKLQGYYYSIILLQGLGITLPNDIGVIKRLSEQISVIKQGDVFPEKEVEIINVIEGIISKACDL